MSTLPFETDVEHNGSVKIQRVGTLPAHGGASDEGRIIYAEDADQMYVGTASAWAQLLDGAASSIDDIPDVDTTGATDGQVLTWNNSTMQWEAADPSGGGGSSQSSHVRLQRAKGVASGQTATANTWNTLLLNTEVDPTGIVTLSSNQITLDTGTYTLRASSYHQNRAQLRIRNITDGTTEVLGVLSESGSAASQILLIGNLTVVGGPKIYELQMWSNGVSIVNQPAAGYTPDPDTEDLVYTSLEIQATGTGSGGGGASASLLAYGEITDFGDVGSGTGALNVTGDLLSATKAVEGADNSSTTTCVFNNALPNDNYNVIFEVISLSGTPQPDNDCKYPVVVSKSTTGFVFNIHDTGGTQDIQINVRIESNVVPSNLSADLEYVNISGTGQAGAGSTGLAVGSSLFQTQDETTSTIRTYAYELDQLAGAGYDIAKVRGVYVQTYGYVSASSTSDDRDQANVNAQFPDGTTHLIASATALNADDDNANGQLVLVPVNEGQTEIILSLEAIEASTGLTTAISEFTIIGVQQVKAAATLVADLDYVAVSGGGAGPAITQSLVNSATTDTYVYDPADLTGDPGLAASKIRGVYVQCTVRSDGGPAVNKITALYPDGSEHTLLGSNDISASELGTDLVALVPINASQPTFTIKIDHGIAAGTSTFTIIGVQQVKTVSGFSTVASVHFDATALPTVNKSKNVASVVRNAAGDFTVTWSTPFPDAFYTVHVNHRALGGGFYGINTIVTQTAAAVNFRVQQTTGAVALDPDIVCVTAFD